MITRSVSNDHLELECTDALELLRLGAVCEGVDVSGVVRASIIFVRQPLDSEDLHEKFTRHLEAARLHNAEIDSQLDWTQP